MPGASVAIERLGERGVDRLALRERRGVAHRGAHKWMAKLDPARRDPQQAGVLEGLGLGLDLQEARRTKDSRQIACVVHSSKEQQQLGAVRQRPRSSQERVSDCGRQLATLECRDEPFWIWHHGGGTLEDLLALDNARDLAAKARGR